MNFQSRQKQTELTEYSFVDGDACGVHDHVNVVVRGHTNLISSFQCVTMSHRGIASLEVRSVPPLNGEGGGDRRRLNTDLKLENIDECCTEKNFFKSKVLLTVEIIQVGSIKINFTKLKKKKQKYERKSVLNKSTKN